MDSSRNRRSTKFVQDSGCYRKLRLDALELAYLVTDGAGFIGSAFVLQCLAEQESPVIVLDKLTYAGNPENLALVAQGIRYRFVYGDIDDAYWLAAS